MLVLLLLGRFCHCHSCHSHSCHSHCHCLLPSLLALVLVIGMFVVSMFCRCINIVILIILIVIIIITIIIMVVVVVEVVVEAVVDAAPVATRR